MTAPVTQQGNEKIAMTAPVTQQGSDKSWRVRFIMPSKYTMETLPKPNNPAIELKEIPAKRFAVIRFSGMGGQREPRAPHQGAGRFPEREKSHAAIAADLRFLQSALDAALPSSQRSAGRNSRVIALDRSFHVRPCRSGFRSSAPCHR